MEEEDTVYAQVVIDQNNHSIVFIFDLTGISDKDNPAGIQLQFHPNPFLQSACIEFYLDNGTQTAVTVYSVQGTVIKILADDWMDKGTHMLTWDGTDSKGIRVAPGIYLVRLDQSGKTDCVRVVRY
jgi:hypothetical protein